ncbi:hypothetical protein CF98_00310 [Halopseudomonas bauzanensis]|nr:hypothetical protein CF98_00310 [Halopseudomonas bauzanensis]
MTTKQQEKDIFVCQRLREERERLGLGQQDVANAVGVSVKTVGRWEKESAIPSKKLNDLSPLEFDVAYVLTGIRTPPSATALSVQEAELLTHYGKLTSEQQGFIRQTVAALVAAGKEKIK